MGILDAPALSISDAKKSYAALALNTYIPIGDSITADPLPYNGPSWARLIDVITGQALRTIRNAGVPGNTSTQALARIQTDVIAYRPRWCSILIGTNDISQSVPFDTWKANVVAMVNACLNAGIKVILCTLPARTDAGGFAQTTGVWNDWIRLYAQSRPGVYLVDFHKATANQPGGLWNTGYAMPDNVHPGPLGAQAMAEAAKTAMLAFLPPAPSILPTHGAAWTQVGPNLLRNPLMVGGPDGWAYSPTTAPAGSTRSVVTDARFVGSASKFSMVNPAAVDGFMSNTAIAAGATTFQPGETLRALARVVITSDTLVSTGNKGLSIKLVCTGAATPDQFVIKNVPNAIDGVVQGEIVVPAGTTSIKYAVTADWSTTGSADVLIGQLGLYNATTLGL